MQIDQPSMSKATIEVLRPHQWVKNLLIFIPIVTSNATRDLNAWTNATVMFLSFCATASGIYVFNDLCDVEADRRHPKKRTRPFASGSLPVVFGYILTPIMLTIGFILASAISMLLFAVGYAGISIAYSTKLKKVPLVDLFVLAALYTIRLFSGGAATGYHVSLWLLAYSGFLFLGLAIIKRVTELKVVLEMGEEQSFRRGYMTQDINMLQQMGIVASFVSSLVLALYAQSSIAEETYRHPKILWIMIPLLLFWQCRLWMATTRGDMHTDPIIYTAKDWVSRLVGLSSIMTLLLANV